MADNDSSIFRYCCFSYSKSIEPNSGGGALSVKYFSKVKVSDCIFNNNSAQLDGGAIYLHRSDMIIQNCQFYNNTAGTGGGAIVTDREVKITLRNNTFINNSTGWRGGAITLYASNAVIDHNIFIENYSQERGGAIYLRQTPGIISANYISNNYSGSHGGGMCLQEKNCQLTNNIVINNSANNAGGGIYFLYIDDFLTSNNTICNNLANTGGGIYNAFSNHKSYNDILFGNDCATYGKQYGLYSTQVSLDFKNSNIEGGPDDIGFWQGQELPGTYTNIVDSFPHFVNPSEGPGNDYDGTISNWDLKSISPCINAGTLAGISNFIGNKDFAGNSRIYADSIDIGAYESQYGIPVITLQPLNQIACADDTVSLIVETQFQSYYQWQKNGEDIPGATDAEYLMEPITPSYDGNYQCIVSNSFGSVASVPVYVVARSTPEIILQPEDTWAVEGERTILSTNATGTPPVRYQWFKETVELQGKKIPELWILETSSNMEGEYYCQISNACGNVYTDTVQLYLAPQICMVTVDTTSGNNLVVWEKNSAAPVESYNIYRESIVAGEYDIIGNVLADDLSVFEDTIADPFSQGYIYKITALDATGNESDLNLCKPHKTIHLLTSINTEEYSIQCDWNQYYGFDYGTFIVYRAIKGSTLDSIHAISRSFNTWIDRSSLENVDYVYRIAARRLETCYPTGNTKAGSGPYSHSMSNIDDNRLQATGKMDIISTESLQIFPNPFSDYTTIRFANTDHSDYQMIVRDLSGKAVMTMSKITEDQVIINRGNLKAGYYSIEVTGEKIFRGKMIVE
jgi:predicted outer membrane repeat protein